MFTLPKYTLELHSTRLTNIEKVECKKFIDRCNNTIRRTFEVLENLDFSQALSLKRGLEAGITDPELEKKLSGLANNRQKRRAKKI